VEFFSPLFDKIGENVKNLTIEQSVIKASKMIEVVKKCPNLKELKIKCWNEEIDEFEELKINLENFRFVGSMELMGVFKNIQTKEFHFSNNRDMRAGPSFDGKLTSIVEFLLNQNELKNLYIDGCYEGPMYALDPRLN
jgi:hypothetical protein